MLSHVPSPYEMAFSIGAPIFTSGQVDVFLKSLAEVYRQDLTERSPGRNKRDWSRGQLELESTGKALAPREGIYIYIEI